jgi:signal transduction histidine kinase
VTIESNDNSTFPVPLAALGVPAAVCDTSGTVESCNRAWGELTGDATDITGATHRDDRAALRRALQAPETADGFALTCRLEGPGRWLWGQLHLSRLESSQVLVTFAPVPDELVEAFASLGAGPLPSGFMAGLGRGTWEPIGDGLPARLGYSAQEFAALTAADLIHPEDAGPLAEALERYSADPQASRFSFTCRMRHADGTWRTIASRGLRVSDATGAAVSINTDITEISRNAAFVDELTRNLNVGVLFVDCNGVVLHANAAAAGLLDTTVTEVMGTPLADHVAAPFRGPLADAVLTPQKLRIPTTDAAGVNGWSLMSSLPVLTGHLCQGAVILVGDLSAQGFEASELEDALASAESANRLQRLLLSRVSHELRTPLNAMLGYAELIERQTTEGPSQLFADKILVSGHRLLGLVDDLVDLAQLDVGELTFDYGDHRLDDLIATAVDQAIPASSEKGVLIQVPGSRSRGREQVWSDEARAVQLLAGSLQSAVALAAPRSTLSVSWGEGSADDIELTIDGTGDELHQVDPTLLFEPLAVSERTELPILTLALCRALVEALGGTVHASGFGDGGGHFRLTLTLPSGRLGQEGSPTPHEDETVDTPLPFTGLVAPSARVLYIDDDALNLALVTQMCSGTDVKLTTCPSGRHGLELVRTTRPDVVLLDLHIPDLDGWEILAAIRSDPDPSIGALPVIVVTADATQSAQRRALASGADAVVVKPFRLDALERFLHPSDH